MKHARSVAMLLVVCAIFALLAGCSSKAVLKIDGKAIPAGYYIYNYCNAYSQASGMGDSSSFSNTAMQNIIRYAVVEKLCKQYGIELQALERKAVLDNINEQMAEQGTSAYKTFLSRMQLSKRQFQDLMYNAAKDTKLKDYFYNEEYGTEKPTDEELYQVFCDNFCCASHILISTQKATEQADYDAALKKIQEIQARVQAGEDFAALAAEYGEDPGLDPEKGYVFPSGVMVQAFEDAAFALEPGQVSDIVQTSYGYHIIKRYPITMELFMEYRDSFYPQAQNYFYQKKIAEEAEKLDVQVLDAMNNLDLRPALSYIMGY